MKVLFNSYSPEVFRPANFDYLLPEPYRKKIRMSRELNRELSTLETKLDKKFGDSKTKRDEKNHARKILKYSTWMGGTLVLSVPLLAVGKYSVGIVEWVIKQRFPYPLSSEDSVLLYRGVEARTGEPSRENPNTIHHGSPLEAALILSLEIKSRKNIARAKRLYGKAIASQLENLYSKLTKAKELLLVSSNPAKASQILREIKRQYNDLEKQLPKRRFAWKFLRWLTFGFMVNKMASDMSGEQGWNDVNDLGHDRQNIDPLEGGPFDWGWYQPTDFAVNDLKLGKVQQLGWVIAFAIRDIVAAGYHSIQSGLRKVFRAFPVP
ncbi:MAG: hypothetical protein ACE5OZ_25835 [Candidatus Heimdallarchaeota archaeon]